MPRVFLLNQKVQDIRISLNVIKMKMRTRFKGSLRNRKQFLIR